MYIVKPGLYFYYLMLLFIGLVINLNKYMLKAPESKGEEGRKLSLPLTVSVLLSCVNAHTYMYARELLFLPKLAIRHSTAHLSMSLGLFPG